MWLAIAIVLFALFFLLFVIPKMWGRQDFWKQCAADPDQAYQLFLADPAWYVVDGLEGRTERPRGSGWTGPFILWVPMLGNRRITIYGESDELEIAQDRLLGKWRIGDSNPSSGYGR